MGDLIFKAGAKLLIDGVDVPFTSAAAGSTPNDFTTCTFSLTATVQAFNIRYRANVLLLVWDENRRDYVALFEGEAKSRGYSFVGSGANCQFTARGLFSHYAKMMMYWTSGSMSMFTGAPVSAMIKMGAEEAVVTGDMEKNTTDASLYLLQLSRMFRQDGSDFEIMKGLQMFLRSGYTNELNRNPNLNGLVSKFYMSRGVYANMIPGMGNGSERYIFENFKSADTFFHDKAAKSLFFRTAQNNMNQRTSRWDYFMYVLNMIHHDAIMPLGSIRHGLIAKPNLYFAMPPACNMLFPGMITSFNFSHNWEQSPTRLLTALNNGNWSADGGVGHDIWYPLDVTNNLFDLFKDGGKSGAGKGPSITIEGKSYQTMYETEEEKLYGYTSAYGTVDYSSVLGALMGSNTQTYTNGEDMLKKNDVTAKAVFKQFALMAKENMQQLKFGTSNGSFMCKYNPNLVPGFPILLIFGPRNIQSSYPIAIIGYLQNVHHTINPSGALSTSGSVSMVRPVWYKPQPEVPAWVGGTGSKVYSDSEIGSKVYKQFLGCGSANEMAKKPGANVEESAKGLYDEYVKHYLADSSGQKAEDWTRDITKRALDTLSTYVKFNNLAMELVPPFDPAVENNAIQLSGPLFTHVEGSRARVEEYVKFLKDNPVMAGV